MFGLILPSRPCLTLDALTPTTYTIAIPPAPPFTHLVVFLLPGTILPPDTAAAVYIRFPSPLGSRSRSSLNPASAAASEFRFLGAVANEKPSAIFRVREYDAGRGGFWFEGGGMGGGGGEDEMVDEYEAPAVNGTGTGTGIPGNAPGAIQLGIAIEPLPQILASLAALASQSQSQPQSQAAAFLQAPNAQPSTTALTKLPPQHSRSASGSPVSTKVLARRIVRNAFNFLASFAGTTAEQGGVEVVPLKAFQEWWVKFERRVEVDPGFLEREGEGEGG